MATGPVAATTNAVPTQPVQNLGMVAPGLASPYTGAPLPGASIPTAPVGYPVEAGAMPGASMPGSLAGMASGQPQVNATNQSALASNGNVNQSVTNENKYENKYYNIITSPSYGFGMGGLGFGSSIGSIGGWGGLYGRGLDPSEVTVDPYTGAMIMNRKTGVLDWLKRLFRGY